MTNPNLEILKHQRLYEKEINIETIAREFGIDRARIIDFSLNVNPLGPSLKAVAAAAGRLMQCNLYPDLMLDDLRAALARRHDVDPHRIAFGCGLDELIKLLVHAWGAPGSTFVMHVPTFPRYELEAFAFGAEPRFVTSDPPWTVSVPVLTAAIAETRPALAFLCSPNNPTGAVIPMEDIDTLCEGNPDTLFVVDEALIDPTKDGAMYIARSRNNVAVLRTFSKYWGLAGFRVGYAVAAEDMIQAIELIRPPFNVALSSAAAALAVLDDEDYLLRAHDLFASEMAYLESRLSEIGAVEIVGAFGNMALLHFKSHFAADVTQALARRGILVVDARSYRGLEGAEVLRISLRERADNEALILALKDVLQ
jgi:histidinol-phosphate aminotransferase